MIVTIPGNTVFTEVIKLKGLIQGGPNPMTDVFIGRRKFAYRDTETQREI